MIKSIELKNWRTHKETKLEFSKGTNILIGQMGSGKSSIMDAIAFALFGTFPAIQHRRVSAGKLIRNKPTQAKEGYVKLNFNLDGNDYSIKRTITLDGKSSATIEHNGSYLQSQPQRVTEEIERILKVDYDIFSRVVYSEQNGLDYFLNLNPTNRKKQIDSLLGLDKFALAQESATALTNRIKDMVADTERIANEFDIEKARKDLDSLNNEKDALIKEKEGSEKKLKVQTETKSKTETKLNSLKSQYDSKLLLAKEIEGLKSKSVLLETEIKKIDTQVTAERGSVLKELENAQKEIDKLKVEDTRLTDSERRFNTTIAKLEADTNSANRDMAEREKLLNKISGLHKPSLEKGIESHNAKVDQLTSAIAESKARAADAEKQMKELEKHISKCPICEREIDGALKSRLIGEKNKIIADSKKAQAEHATQLEKLRADAKALSVQLNELIFIEGKLKALTGVDEKLQSYKKSLSDAKSEYEKIKAAKDKSSKSIMSSMDAFQKLKSTTDALERRERHAEEKKKIDLNLSKKSADHDLIKVNHEDIEKLQQEFVQISAEISKLRANLDASSRYIKDKELQIKDKESEITKIDKIKEDAKKKKETIDNLSKFRQSLFETQSILRSQLISSINSIMQEVWQGLYPYGDYRGLMLDASSDDYRLKVKTLVNNDYVWEDVESIASGGERSTACLSMRIAFSLVLVPNLKWLILDEPTHNIDREGLSKFVQMFGETLPKIVDQVFIITHDEVLKQVSSAKIYSFSRNKAENRETEVAEN
ncbi:MAG: AAA family ATPase [Candidatus Micrarchaeota archaeon]|nr:AAA family ATPase [Candidatus Micrarchaeota archaeon]MDE1859543.1 AAA family ATPase [Candidatus Micrarchaeota archaeon]